MNTRKAQVLFPMAAPPAVAANVTPHYPFPLTEIEEKLLVEWAVADYQGNPAIDDLIFVVSKNDCQSFFLDDTLHLVAPNSTVIQAQGPTQGALCTCLLAVDKIDADRPLLIANYDQTFFGRLTPYLDRLMASGADAGALCFDSLHPRCSFMRCDETGAVVEVAEKQPISRHAIAGVYYFRSGKDFVRHAKRNILRGATIRDSFFIAPVLNEYILAGAKVAKVDIDSDRYVSFTTEETIRQYQRRKFYPAPKKETA